MTAHKTQGSSFWMRSRVSQGLQKQGQSGIQTPHERLDNKTTCGPGLFQQDKLYCPVLQVEKLQQCTCGLSDYRTICHAQALHSVFGSWLSRKFFGGCAVLFPMVVTVYITWWFLTFFDNFFSVGPLRPFPLQANEFFHSRHTAALCFW